MNINMPILFMDAAPPIGLAIGAVAAVIFFVVCAVVAFAAFVMLKKSLKMAFRIGVVVVILVIAFLGVIACLYLGILSSGGSPAPRPAPTRPR